MRNARFDNFNRPRDIALPLLGPVIMFRHDGLLMPVHPVDDFDPRTPRPLLPARRRALTVEDPQAASLGCNFRVQHA